MAMIDCNYEHVGPGDKYAHRYRCTACGHERESDHPPGKLHRRCGDPPSVRLRVLQQIDLWSKTASLSRLREEIEAQLDRCLADCRHFNGHVCTYRGGQCTCWKRWLETLAVGLGPCREWEDDGNAE